ncbi:unnamed protein product, partial [marine sediment metagenome]
GKAVQTIRAYSKTKCQVGLAPVGIVSIPATDSPEDIEAARQTMFSVASKDETLFSVPSKNVWNNTWWLDPVRKLLNYHLSIFGEPVRAILV